MVVAPTRRINYLRVMELEWQRGTVESGGEDIYWELTSTGADDDRPVVVLSHGAGGCHAIWFQQVPVIGEQFRVVTWDSRGFGNSTNRTERPSPDGAAADLAAVLDHLDIERAHLVGQSMGGWHIAAFARASAERVLSLTFADTVGGLWTDELRQAMADFQSRGGLGGSGSELIGGHRALWPGTAERDKTQAFLYQALGSLHNPPMAQIGETIGWTMAHAEVAALGVPILFIVGSHDQIFPVAALAESCRLLPEAEFVEVAGAGHSPYFEQPSVWNDALLQFLLPQT